jgi:hypothetical protein
MKVHEIISESGKARAEKWVANKAGEGLKWGWEKIVGKGLESKAMDKLTDILATRKIEALQAGKDYKNVHLSDWEINQYAGGFVEKNPKFLEKVEELANKAAAKQAGFFGSRGVTGFSAVKGTAGLIIQTPKLAYKLVTGSYKALMALSYLESLTSPWRNYVSIMEQAKAEYLDKGKVIPNYETLDNKTLTPEESFGVFNHDQYRLAFSKTVELAMVAGALGRLTPKILSTMLFLNKSKFATGLISGIASLPTNVLLNYMSKDHDAPQLFTELLFSIPFVGELADGFADFMQWRGVQATGEVVVHGHDWIISKLSALVGNAPSTPDKPEPDQGGKTDGTANTGTGQPNADTPNDPNAAKNATSTPASGTTSTPATAVDKSKWKKDKFGYRINPATGKIDID